MATDEIVLITVSGRDRAGLTTQLTGVLAGVAYARANGLRVIPTCWYARDANAADPDLGDVL